MCACANFVDLLTCSCSLLVGSMVRPGVNFNNILWAAFMRADPKSAKKTVKLSSFIALLGSASVKAAFRMLMKLTPGPACMYGFIDLLCGSRDLC